MRTSLQPGDVLPGCSLQPLGGGEPFRIGGPGASRSQVVVLTHPEPCDGCRAYLASFEEVTDRLRDENADVFAVVGPAWDGAHRPAPGPVRVGVDDGRLGPVVAPARTPVVAVADRFGQLFASFGAGSEHAFPDHERMLSILLDIAIRCPECGVPDVPGMTTMPEPDAVSGRIPGGGG